MSVPYTFANATSALPLSQLDSNFATPPGREVMLKNIAAQTVVSASTNIEPINGGATTTAILPATIGSWVTLVSNGVNWVIMQKG